MIQGRADSASLAATLADDNANPSLRSLRLCDAGLTPNLAVQIADFLEENQTLTEVDLSGNAIGSHGASCIAASLQKNTTLKRLVLANCSLKSDVVAPFTEYFQVRARQVGSSRTGLQCLDLSGNQLEDDAAEALGGLIVATAELSDQEPLALNLRKNWLSDDAVRAIAAAMQHNRTLTVLRLEGNQDEEAVVAKKQIAFYLQRNLKARERSLFLGQVDAIRASMISLQDCKIEHVDLSLSDAQLLCDALKDNRSILSLQVRDNALPSEGTRRVLAALRRHPSLRSLGIQDNEVGQSGFIELTRLLQQSGTLRSLAVGNSTSVECVTPPSSETLAGLHRTLARDTTTMRSLALTNCGFGDLELSVILPGIAWLGRLESLDLRNNAFGDRVAAILERLVERCTRLERLDVRGSQLTLLGAEILCRAVPVNLSMHTLLLGRFRSYSEAQIRSIMTCLRASDSLVRVDLTTTERASRCADQLEPLLLQWATRREQSDRVSNRKRDCEREADAQEARYRSAIRQTAARVVNEWFQGFQ